MGLESKKPSSGVSVFDYYVVLSAPKERKLFSKIQQKCYPKSLQTNPPPDLYAVVAKRKGQVSPG